MRVTPSDRMRDAAATAVIELYRDHILTAEQARLILNGLGATTTQIRTLSHAE